MSVALTREEDVAAAAAHLPDRPISPHPNLVTSKGLAELDEALAAARDAYGAAQAAGDVQADRTAMARAARDLRYYTARRASARVVELNGGSETVVLAARSRLIGGSADVRPSALSGKMRRTRLEARFPMRHR